MVSAIACLISVDSKALLEMLYLRRVEDASGVHYGVAACDSALAPEVKGVLTSAAEAESLASSKCTAEAVFHPVHPR